MLSFLPPVLNSPSAGWGPPNLEKDDFLSLDIPYAPFSKGDKLGKAADWTNTSTRPVFPVSRGQPVTTAFNAFEDEEEDFSIVDNRVFQRPGYRKTFVQRNQPLKLKQPRQRGGTNWQSQAKRGKAGQSRVVNPKATPLSKKRGGTGSSTYYPRSSRKFNPSIEVQPTWGDPLFQIEFSTLISSRLDRDSMPEVETISTYGKLERYNNAYNKVNTRLERPLERQWAIERRFYQVTTSDDPILMNIAKENTAKNENKERSFFYATDAVLVVLMSALRSAYAWDILVTRDKDGNFFLDKRDDSLFDFHTVNENSAEPPADDPELGCNSAEALGKEATVLNYNFSQQLLFKDSSKDYKFPEPNPFPASEDEKVASVAYIYRSWDFGDDVVLVARTEVDGYKSKAGKPCFLTLRALNEYDVKITGGWRKKLESQKAGCFATELKNNNCRLAKWMIQAHLAGSHLKIGYVSRVSPKDNMSHVILAITDHNTNEFAYEIGADYTQIWGSLKTILDQLTRIEEEGTYIILRDPNRKHLQVFKVPSEELKRDTKRPTK